MTDKKISPTLDSSLKDIILGPADSGRDLGHMHTLEGKLWARGGREVVILLDRLMDINTDGERKAALGKLAKRIVSTSN